MSIPVHIRRPLGSLTSFATYTAFVLLALTPVATIGWFGLLGFGAYRVLRAVMG